MKSLLVLCCLVGALGVGSILGLLGMGKFTIEWPSLGNGDASEYPDGHTAARNTPARYEMCSPDIGTASLIPDGSASTYEKLGWCYGTCPCADVPVDPETVRKCRDGTYLGCDAGKPVCWDRPPSDGRAPPASSVDLECFVPVPPSGTRSHTGHSDDTCSICHIPPGNPFNVKTLSLPLPAVSAHVGHGDCVGKCPCANCLVIADPSWVACPLMTTRDDCLGPRCIIVTPSANITIGNCSDTNCSKCPAPPVNCTASCPVPPPPALNCTASCPMPEVNCSSLCPAAPPPAINCTASCPSLPGTNVSMHNYTKCFEHDDDDDDDDVDRPEYCTEFENICALCPFNTTQCPPPVVPSPNCTALGCSECASDPSCVFCASGEYGSQGACQFLANATETCTRVISTITDIGECFSAPPPIVDCGVECPPVLPACDGLGCVECELASHCAYGFLDEFGDAGACMPRNESCAECVRTSFGQPDQCYVSQPTNCTASLNCTGLCPSVNCTEDCPVTPPTVDCATLSCAECSLASECAFCSDTAYGPTGTCLNASDIGFAMCARDVVTAGDCFVQPPPPPTNCSECPVPPANCSECPAPPTNCSECLTPPANCSECPPPPVDCAASCPIDPSNCTSTFNCTTLCPPTPVDCTALGCAECAFASECAFCFDTEHGSSGQCYATADLPGESCVRTAEVVADECYHVPPMVCDNSTDVCGWLSSTNETFCAYLLPAVNCMQPSGPDFVVYWGYYSSSPDTVNVPVGPENMFESPSLADLGQPDAFQHGSHSGVFTTLRAPGDTQTWALGYGAYGVQGLATANDNTPLCYECAAIDDCGSCAETVGCLWCDGSCVAGSEGVPLDTLLVCNATNDCGCENQQCGSMGTCGFCTLTPGCVWCNSSSECVSSDSDDAMECNSTLDSVAKCSGVTLVLDQDDIETLREEVCCTDEPRGWVSSLVVLGMILSLAVLLGILLFLVILFTRRLRQNKED